MQSKTINTNNLKGLREDKGLSIEAVASSLKLTTAVIRKLENSEFESLGAYPYVRGYLILYANLLGVEAQEYIDLIPKSHLIVPLVNTKSNNTRSIKLKKHSKNILNYAIGTFIVIGISFSGYYLLKNFSGSAEPNIEIAQPSGLEIVPQTQFADEQLPALVEENTDTFHYSSLIPTEPTSNGIASDKIKDANEIQIPEQEVINGDEETSVNLEVKNELPVKSYNIAIATTQESWLKVEQLSGEKLHNDLLQPGSINLSSDTPVHFRIGNAKQVSISINGEAVDLSKYSVKDVADFTWPLENQTVNNNPIN